MVATAPHHPDAAAAYAERDAVLRALGQLRREYQLALMFRYLDRMSVREVAKLLGRSEKATESLLTRAREGFRVAYRGSTDA
jgi:RNA polymerase sigma-70 factor (ECF subfamily)